MMHHTREGMSERPGMGFKRGIALLLGSLLLLLAYQVFRQQVDVRLQAGLLGGNLVACVAWMVQLHSGRVRWWVTGLFGVAAAIVVAPVVHVVLGGSPDLAAEVAAGLGLQAGLLVAITTGGGLHLLSYGLGIGRWGDLRHDRGDSADEDGTMRMPDDPAPDSVPEAEPREIRSEDGRASRSTRLEALTPWLVGAGITIAAGWRAAGWQGEVGIDRLISAVTYPAWLFALVGTVLWWSRRTRGYIPIAMAALSIVVAWGHFVMASDRNPKAFAGTAAPSAGAELTDKEKARIQEARRLLEAEAQRIQSDSMP